jgi:predicted peptidase
MKKRSAKKTVILRALTALLCLTGLSGIFWGALRIRPPLNIQYDAAYWPEKTVKSGSWAWCMTPSGIIYNLYIPEAMDKEGIEERIPLIVVFHGAGGKGTAKDRFGRIFTDAAAQKKIDADGAAVLVVQSRLSYFSDPHAYARLIKNVVMEHHSIDGKRIAGYGFSQGAAFVQELGMYDPGLFTAVASGSSYYSASFAEYLRGSRVRFYSATSRNDKGIFEQGHRTGRLLSKICPDSRYVEYAERGHFFIEMSDKSGKGEETFGDWLAGALRK